MTPPPVILTAQFDATVYSERHEGDFEVSAEVTGAVSVDDSDTYVIRLQSITVGTQVYRPAMVSPRVAAQAEDALIGAYERREREQREASEMVKTIIAIGEAAAMPSIESALDLANSVALCERMCGKSKEDAQLAALDALISKVAAGGES